MEETATQVKPNWVQSTARGESALPVQSRIALFNAGRVFVLLLTPGELLLSVIFSQDVMFLRWRNREAERSGDQLARVGLWAP